MPKKINLQINESASELRKLISKTPQLKRKHRLKFLLLIKEKKVDYLTTLESRLKYRRKTIRGWLNDYRTGGLSALLSIKSGGNRKTIITKVAHQDLWSKLSNPSTEITSYVELLNWYQQHYDPNMKYISLYSYCRRKFKSKLKVARKSHINKDLLAEEVLKKNYPYY